MLEGCDESTELVRTLQREREGCDESTEPVRTLQRGTCEKAVMRVQN